MKSSNFSPFFAFVRWPLLLLSFAAAVATSFAQSTFDPANDDTRERYPIAPGRFRIGIRNIETGRGAVR